MANFDEFTNLARFFDEPVSAKELADVIAAVDAIKREVESGEAITCDHCKRMNPPYAKTKDLRYLCRVCVDSIFRENY